MVLTMTSNVLAVKAQRVGQCIVNEGWFSWCPVLYKEHSELARKVAHSLKHLPLPFVEPLAAVGLDLFMIITASSVMFFQLVHCFPVGGFLMLTPLRASCLLSGESSYDPTLYRQCLLLTWIVIKWMGLKIDYSSPQK